jgi:DeoR-like helix-turn-helix domain.
MTEGESDTSALRREGVRQLLDEHPVVMVGDAADELDVSAPTARRYLEELETANPAIESRDASGGRIWYLKDAAADGGVPALGEVEHHFQELWSDRAAGRALICGLSLALIIMIVSTISLATDTAGWSTVHRRTETLVHLLSVIAWPMIAGPAWALWRAGELRP